jgi:nitrogen fixation NifU-like protein
MMYSEIVMDHFKNPRNVGVIEDADGIGEVGNPVCGDMMTITIKVKDNRIEDIKFQTFGCGSAIAVSSMVTEMAKGKTLEEALKITNKSVVEKLGGLPKNKLHCSNLGADALHQAIMDYYSKQKQHGKGIKREKVNHIRKTEGGCYCPFCDIELPKEAPYCTNCGRPVESKPE